MQLSLGFGHDFALDNAIGRTFRSDNMIMIVSVVVGAFGVVRNVVFQHGSGSRETRWSVMSVSTHNTTGRRTAASITTAMSCSSRVMGSTIQHNSSASRDGTTRVGHSQWNEWMGFSTIYFVVDECGKVKTCKARQFQEWSVLSRDQGET